MLQVDIITGVVIQLHLSPDGCLGTVISRVDQTVVHVKDVHTIVTKKVSLVSITLSFKFEYSHCIQCSANGDKFWCMHGGNSTIIYIHNNVSLDSAEGLRKCIFCGERYLAMVEVATIISVGRIIY